MTKLAIPDVASQLSPNISFKTQGDKAAILNIMQGEYSEVVKFNQAPARKALEFADKLDAVAKQKLKAKQIAHSSLVFELRETTEAERQKLVEDHQKALRDLNDANVIKKKVQRDGKGDTVEKYPLHIDVSKSQYVPPTVVSTGRVKNLIQAKPDKQGPQKGHWAKDKNGKPIYKGGKRLWIEGQHNYNRQRNPRTPDEAVLGTKVMNNNWKMRACKDEKGNYVDEIDLEAHIVRVGMDRKVHDRSTQDEIITPALKEAVEIIRRKFSAAYQMVPKAESIQSLVTEEDHK